MDNRNRHTPEPWEQDSYRTGSTHPPKSHSGAIAVLLTAVILLCGVTTALGMLNIKLFSQLNQADDPAAGFYDSDMESLGSSHESAPSESSRPQELTTLPTGDSSLVLDKAPESVENVPQEGGLSFQQIYESTIHSVVSISCTGENAASSGTGVVLTENGYIVTNCHVIAGAEQITVLLTDDRQLPAQVVGSDAVSDLAVLYVQARDLTPARFGDSDQLRVGDSVVAIGDPLGVELRGTMTDGIISAINRDVETGGRTMTLIQTNAALNSGNSGGPLINCYGQVIGINTLKIGAFTDNAGVEGLGFAIPSTTVKEIVDQLIRQGYVSGRPTLGFEGKEVSLLEQRFYRLPEGLLITAVTAGSDAENKGICMGDVLVRLGTVRITSAEDVSRVLYGSKAGDTLEAVIYRGGRYYNLKLTLEEAGA